MSVRVLGRVVRPVVGGDTTSSSVGISRFNVRCGAALAVAFVIFSGSVRAQETSPDLKEMRAEIEALKRSDREKSQKIADLEGLVRSLEQRPATAAAADSPEAALEAAVKDLQSAGGNAPTAYSGSVPGAGSVRLMDLSLSTTIIGGTSSAPNGELALLKAGDHDPSRRGFRVPNTELSASGAVDPYFTAEAHIVYAIEPETGESAVELEEAFITTTSLPFGLQIEAGQSLLEFGRINPQHPHQWDFIDQPVAVSRMFGPDGMRGPGVRLGWLIPVDWFAELHLGVYNADGDTMASFIANEEFYDSRAIGGRPFADNGTETFADLCYLMRLAQNFDVAEDTNLNIGLSAVHGPNATGKDGDTWVWGADVLLKWRPAQNERGWPFVTWQTEFIKRDFNAASYFDEGNPLDPTDDVAIASDTLEDWGLYTQVVWGFETDWAAGLRFEYASGSGGNVDPLTGFALDRSDDPFRDDRMRFSTLITYSPSHFSKLRLQYDFDVADHLDHDAHSIFLSLEVLIGAHPAHQY